MRDLSEWDDAVPELRLLLAKLWEAYSRNDPTARTVTVKIKFSDFQQITRSRSSTVAITTREMLEQISVTLLQPHFPPPRGIRLLGVTLSNFGGSTGSVRQQLMLGLAP
jgi:DNA polymerase-4